MTYVNHVHGDLLEMAKRGEFDVIVHGCNCFCTMGSGIAKQLRDTWPSVYSADCRTAKADKSKLGAFTSSRQVHSAIRLGEDGFVESVKEHNFYVINAYTQYNYGTNPDVVYFDYDAFRRFLLSFSQYIELMYRSGIRHNERGRLCLPDKPVVRIGFPLIGAGRANGDFTLILGALRTFSKSLKGWAEITVVEFAK